MREQSRQPMIDSWIQWILLFGILCIPLITRAKALLFISPEIMVNIANTGLKADVYSYYKWCLLLFITTVLVILFSIKLLSGYRIKQSFINIPLVLLTLCLLISATTADYKNLALFGMYNRYEGTLTYLCYYTLFFIAANTCFNNKSFFTKAFIALSLVIGVNAILNLSVFFDYRSINEAVATSLVIPDELSTAKTHGIIYGTLSNPNYYSGFAGGLLAFFFYVAACTNNVRLKVGGYLLVVISFALLLSSLSSSGFISFAVILPVMIIVLIVKAQNKRKTTVTVISLLATMSLVFWGMNSFNPRVYDETLKLMAPMQQTASIIFNNKEFNLVRLAEANTDTKVNEPINEFDLPEIKTTAGTGRVYIWQKTMELIKNSPLYGYGLDTFLYNFPQNDKHLMSNIGETNTYVDKPHNMYLNFAYGTGIVGFGALLCLLVLYILKVGEKVIKSNEGSVNLIATFFFCLTFMIQFLFNDSVIGTSIVFWILMGYSVSQLDNIC
ncbi:O-antigen ligase family protein [Desulfotomaculum defluvii]